MPTLRPTNATEPQYTIVEVTTPDTEVYQSQPHTQYLVNCTGHVTISNDAGFNKYSVTANPQSLLTITVLNKSTDVIDLTVFKMITSFDQLNLTEGSVIVTLPYRQKVHILNLHLSDVSAKNFLLHKADSSIPEPTKTVRELSLAVGIVIAVVGFLCVSYLAYRFYTSKMKERAARLFKNQDHFLVTVKYNADGTEIEDDEESNFSWGEISWNSRDQLSMNYELEAIEADSILDEEDDESNGSPPLSDFSINSEGDFVDKL